MVAGSDPALARNGLFAVYSYLFDHSAPLNIGISFRKARGLQKAWSILEIVVFTIISKVNVVEEEEREQQ